MASYLYRKLTWPEVNAAVQAGKLVLIPAAVLEDHGPHLPIDADVVIAEGICQRVAERIPDEVLLFPAWMHGYSPHHLDFPGPITIRWDTLIEHTLDITRSLAYHGFRRMLIVNAHGSNAPLMDLVARLTIIEHPEVLCATLSWWELEEVRRVGSRIIESPVTSHACELETSLYLALEPEGVQMDKAAADMSFPVSPHTWRDMLGRKPDPQFKSPIRMMEYWSTLTQNGVRGDPTKASREKGLALLEAAVGELVEIVRELRARPIRPRVDHRVSPPS